VVAQEPAAKWRKWWLKRSISKGATFWRNDYAVESERLETWEEKLLLWLILEV